MIREGLYICLGHDKAERDQRIKRFIEKINTPINSIKTMTSLEYDDYLKHKSHTYGDGWENLKKDVLIFENAFSNGNLPQRIHKQDFPMREYVLYPRTYRSFTIISDNTPITSIGAFYKHNAKFIVDDIEQEDDDISHTSYNPLLCKSFGVHHLTLLHV